MKIKKSTLKQIIKEEIEKVRFALQEQEEQEEQVAQGPLEANAIAPAVYAGMKANKNRSGIRAGDFVNWGKKNGLELEYVHATDTTRPGRQPSQLAFRVLRTSDKSKALEAEATGIADHVHVVQPPKKDKPYYILYSGEGIVDRTSQANMKTTDSNSVPFDYKK
jgi:hypothetical protein